MSLGTFREWLREQELNERPENLYDMNGLQSKEDFKNKVVDNFSKISQKDKLKAKKLFNSFIEKMNLENFIKRVEIFGNLQEYNGKLFPIQKILKDIFRMDDDEIDENFKAIQKEEKDLKYAKFYASEEE